jgi:MFS family permease
MINNSPDNATAEHGGFDWSQKEKGVVLSSFFYGYIVTQFVGGYLASRIGGSTVFGIGILITSVAALFTPPIVNFADVPGMVFIRVIQGIAAGKDLIQSFVFGKHMINSWFFKPKT